MNILHLDDINQDLIQLWQDQSRNMPFFRKIHVLTKYYSEYYKEQAQKFREEESNAIEQLKLANDRLQEQSLNLERQQEQGHLQSVLHSIKMKVIVGKQIRSRICWKLRGDMVLAEFFKAVQER